MMRFVVFILTGLLGVSLAGADMIPAGDGCNTCQADADGRIKWCTLLACLPPSKGTIIVPEDPCLAQMEAAMKAMEPYLAGPVTRATRIDFERVLDQWNAAKASCWRTP